MSNPRTFDESSDDGHEEPHGNEDPLTDDINMPSGATEKSPSISLREKFFINSVTRPGIHLKKNFIFGIFVTCLLLTMIILQVNNIKGRSILSSTKHEYVDALKMYRKSNRWSSVRNDVNTYATGNEYLSLHQVIMEDVQLRLSRFQTNLTTELSEIKKKLNNLDQKLQRMEEETVMESLAIERGLIIKNLSSVEGDTLNKKWQNFATTGLNVFVKIEKIERGIPGHSLDPFFTFVILETAAEKTVVLNARRNLKRKPEFDHVTIEPYGSPEARKVVENLQTLIRALGKEDELVFRNGKLFMNQENRDNA